MENYYTVSEVAKILRCKPGKVYEMLYMGRLKAVRLYQTRGYRIAEHDLNQFLESCRIG